MDTAVNKVDMVTALWSLQFSVMSVIQKEVQGVMGDMARKEKSSLGR